MKKLLLHLFTKNPLLPVKKRMSPPQTIVISFIMVILVGTILLFLPISQQPDQNVNFLDALFTATSAVCVTGLVTVYTASTWSIVGKIILLCLIQIGGLSLITFFTYFLVQFGKKVTLKDRLTVQAAYNINDMNGMVRMVMLVLRGTLLCEGVGAIVLFTFFMKEDYTWYQSLFYGIFHSVSAFCNAGFDVIGSSSFEPFYGSFLLNIVIMILIILGGIGFSVWRDILQTFHYRLKPLQKQRIRLSMHTKLVLLTTALLIVLGWIYFFLSEFHNPQTIGSFSLSDKLLASLFQSVTLRTAGYATIPQGGLMESSKLISSIFMLIGGSPGGTAGGMKTVTFIIILCSVWSTIKGRNNITAFKRTIPTILLQKSLAIVVIMLLLWTGGSLLLAITEYHSIFPYTFADLLFEVASALGTVGLTTGITPYLSVPGKLLIILCMFIGRIGPIALLLSLSSRPDHNNEKILYPKEDVMIG